MSRTTHHEGTFAAEIEAEPRPPKGRSWWMRCGGKWIPESVGQFLDSDDAGELTIHHESEITADTSGDHETPNAPDTIETGLVRAEVNGQRLPQALAEQLFELFRDRIEEQVADR